ncbi:MAG: hypothetical protein AAF439_09320 [Pseudomonadota bacterium]
MRIFSVMAVAILAACTQLNSESLPGIGVDDSFTTGGFRWTSGGRLTIATKVFESEGRTAICGAWAESPYGGNYEGELNPQAIAAARASIGGELLARGLNFYRKVAFDKSLTPRGTAKCLRTSVPWQKRFATATPKVEFVKTRFRLID